MLGLDEVVEVSQEKELVPIQCLRQTEFKGTYVGTPFSDADTISKEVTKPMRMYAVQFCETINRVVGLRFFLADTEDNNVRTKLEAHGITEGTIICGGEVLPSQIITEGRIFSREMEFEGRVETSEVE